MDDEYHAIFLLNIKEVLHDYKNEEVYLFEIFPNKKTIK